MTDKSEYHYKQAKRLLRLAESKAHIASAREEHSRLLELAEAHMKLAELCKPVVRPSGYINGPFITNTADVQRSPAGDVIA